MANASDPTPVLLLAAASCPEDAQSAAELVDVAESRLARYEEGAQLQETA